MIDQLPQAVRFLIHREHEVLHAHNTAEPLANELDVRTSKKRFLSVDGFKVTLVVFSPGKIPGVRPHIAIDLSDIAQRKLVYWSFTEFQFTRLGISFFWNCFLYFVWPSTYTML